MIAGRMTWANPVRVGETTAPTIEERTHAPDPAAVARLNALMAAERAARAERRAADKDARAIAAKLRARRKGQTTKPVKADPPPGVAPPQGKQGRARRAAE